MFAHVTEKEVPMAVPMQIDPCPYSADAAAAVSRRADAAACSLAPVASVASVAPVVFISSFACVCVVYWRL